MQVPKEREKNSSVTDNKCTKECDARACDVIVLLLLF